MLQHIRNIHKVAVDVKKLMKCDVCGTAVPTMEKYSEHHIATHNFDAEYAHMVFRNDKGEKQQFFFFFLVAQYAPKSNCLCLALLFSLTVSRRTAFAQVPNQFPWCI